MRTIGSCRWLLAAAALVVAAPLAARVVTELPVVENPVALAVAQRHAVSLAQATRLALHMYPGKVVRAETVSRGGRTEHLIRIFGDDGRVRDVRVDAMTGRIL